MKKAKGRYGVDKNEFIYSTSSRDEYNQLKKDPRCSDRVVFIDRNDRRVNSSVDNVKQFRFYKSLDGHNVQAQPQPCYCDNCEAGNDCWNRDASGAGEAKTMRVLRISTGKSFKSTSNFKEKKTKEGENEGGGEGAARGATESVGGSKVSRKERIFVQVSEKDNSFGFFNDKAKFVDIANRHVVMYVKEEANNDIRVGKVASVEGDEFKVENIDVPGRYATDNGVYVVKGAAIKFCVPEKPQDDIVSFEFDNNTWKKIKKLMI